MHEIAKLDRDDPDTKSVDIVTGNIEALKALFPEAFGEGRIDFEVLKGLLGADVDESDEKYGLNWHGKRRARQIALTPSTGTLLPCPDDSVDWDTTQNVMIEGDNLEVLKLLQKSYASKVKLIYIDPPYNTGKDFVYPDNFRDSIRNYLELTGQIESGQKLSSNTESSGRFHTDWLNMMYPRIKLSKNLLSEDGMIMISIDENEHTHLKFLCDELFGSENYAGEIVWKNSSRNDQNYVSVQHEYFVIYCKNKNVNKGEWVEKKDGIDEIYRAFAAFRAECGTDWASIHKKALEWFGQFSDSNPIRDSKHYSWMDEKGVYFPDNISGPNVGQYVYDVVHPETKKVVKAPSRGWFCPETKMKELIRDNLVHFGSDETTVPCLKTYLKNTEYRSITSLKFQDGRAASKRLSTLFGESVFTNPKDEELLCSFFKAFGLGGRDLVLDFFAGSATTAHAVFELNSRWGSACRSIMVQIPEDLREMHKSAAGVAKNNTRNAIEYLARKNLPLNVCEIAKERIRLVGNKYRSAAQLTGQDFGFKSVKLALSCFRAWEPNVADLENSLLQNAEHLLHGRTERDILYELLLKLGLDLCVPIETQTIVGKAVHSVGGGALIVCLSDGLTPEAVEPLSAGIVAWLTALAPAVDTRVVFKDSGFADDIAKTNMAAILNQNGISDVRSL